MCSHVNISHKSTPISENCGYCCLSYVSQVEAALWEWSDWVSMTTDDKALRGIWKCLKEFTWHMVSRGHCHWLIHRGATEISAPALSVARGWDMQVEWRETESIDSSSRLGNMLGIVPWASVCSVGDRLTQCFQGLCMSLSLLSKICRNWSKCVLNITFS